MGWYLRKSLRFGPLRFNLSKSGIGTSIGIKGLRVGTGPKGSYVQGGRDGLYFRERLGEPPPPPPLPGLRPNEETNVADAPPPKDGLMRLIRRLFSGRQ